MRSTVPLCRLAAALIVFSGALCVPVSAQLPFFSGAEGYGGSFSGVAPAGGWFSNATIYHVTNLNDSGAGSLRSAFTQNTSNKIIVFDVAGTIQLTTASLDIKNLSNYYIAGQTAPGPITIYGATTKITASNNKTNSNVILRYLTFRGSDSGDDTLTFKDGNSAAPSNNMIVDHVSASWSEDEILSVANYNTNITVQYSVINDALVDEHAYGSLIRPRIDSNVSFHHNFYANNASRQARFGTYNAELLTADFRNNVVYNWRDRASYAGGSSETEQEFVDVNYVGNYLIAGPSTIENENTAFIVDKNVDVRAFQSGNYIDSDQSSNPSGQPNGADTGWGMFAFNAPITDQTLTQMATPFATPAVTTQSAIDGYWQTLKHVGNFWWLRDDPTTLQDESQAGRDLIDSRVIGNVLNNTNPPNGVAANAPNAAELNGVLTAPMITRPAGWDTDNDGMPDVWEVAHGLNPSSPVATPDWKLDFDNDGFINLLEYINEAGEVPAPAPIVFNGETNNRYAVITNWKTNDGVTTGNNWQPARFDEAQINSGTVVVDAAGQHAGLLKIASNAANNATLNVTSGWLDVDEEIVIGAHAAATATLNLSGGVLSTGELSKGAGDTFNFTGGVMHADTINFDLINNGGTLAPGHSIGQTHVMGDLTLSSGSLQIELASAALSDQVIVDGDVKLGGSLSILLMPGFTPTTGNSWLIISAGSIMGGQFSSITAGYSVQQQGDNLMLFFGAAPPLVLAGDYNDDGVVDAGDYVVWRKAMAGGIILANETDSVGSVDQADYDAWQNNFGGADGNGSGGAVFSNVPEPHYWALFAIAAGAGLSCRRPVCGFSDVFCKNSC